MERKVILALFLVSCMSFVLSLECYECQSVNKPCENPMTQMCAEDETCCVSLLYQGTYGRGCTSNKKICDTKSSDGKGFDKCTTCETDLLLSLECYECQSVNKPCENPMTQMCAEDETCCVSLLYQGTYGRGCTSNKKICDTKSSDGKGFDKCTTCETDLCNDS